MYEQLPMEFPLSVKALPCANGETVEFRVMLGDQVIDSDYRTVNVGDSLSQHAIRAFLKVTRRLTAA